ncbi:MAG: biotin/lipoyl attachment protein [Proteobacteria bacterium]|nr:biotin/lipoyl attachment protein [Pseudomonadota bacterium]
MTFEEIETIVRRLDGQHVATVNIRSGEAHLRLRFATAQASQSVPVEPPPALVMAPSPGRFRPEHPLEGAPRFSEGDQVGKGETIAFIEVNDLLLPVAATADLTLGRALAKDGDAVGWGTLLYETR